MRVLKIVRPCGRGGTPGVFDARGFLQILPRSSLTLRACHAFLFAVELFGSIERSWNRSALRFVETQRTIFVSDNDLTDDDCWRCRGLQIDRFTALDDGNAGRPVLFVQIDGSADFDLIIQVFIIVVSHEGSFPFAALLSVRPARIPQSSLRTQPESVK